MSNEQDGLLTETIARHFPQARVEENEIDLGFGGLSIGCRVNSVGEFGVFKTASLFFQLRGGALGAAPVFASISGYGDSDHDAIVSGGCNWACSFGPVLRAGLAGEANSKVERFDVTVDGQSYQLFVDGIDRTFWSSGGDQAAERIRIVRARLGGWPWLSRVMLDSGRLPLMPVKHSTILSVFVGSRPDGLTVEVKINGVDWPGMAEALAGAANEPPGAVTLLRELAVLVPVGPQAPLQREPVARTLAGLQRHADSGSRVLLRWGLRQLVQYPVLHTNQRQLRGLRLRMRQHRRGLRSERVRILGAHLDRLRTLRSRPLLDLGNNEQLRYRFLQRDDHLDGRQRPSPLLLHRHALIPTSTPPRHRIPRHRLVISTRVAAGMKSLLVVPGTGRKPWDS